MDLYLYSKRLDLAATTLDDLKLLVAALADETNAANAATIALVTSRVPPLVQSDVAEPLTIRSYDDAGITASSWIADAAVTVTVGLGVPNADTNADYTTAVAAIAGSTRLASLVLNTQALRQALSQYTCRPGAGKLLYLHIRQSPANGGETVLLMPVQVQPGVLSSPTNEDNVADISAAAASAAAAAASAVAASASAGASSAGAVSAGNSATAAAASETAADLSAGAAAASETAADLSQVAAAASAVAADSSATEAENAEAAAEASQVAAAASATAASTSQSSAAASAVQAALISAGLTFVGTVAGASLPATSTAAGYFYVITTAGTGQSITWAVGDLAIYKGTSGQWSQIPSSNALAAVLNAGLGNLTNSRAIRDCLYADGATTSARAYWTLGTAGNLATAALHVPWLIRNDATSGAVVRGIWAFSSATTGVAASSLALYRSSNDLVLELIGATPGTDFRKLTYANFFTTFAAGWMALNVDWARAAAPTIYSNGIALTMTETTGGTPPAWTAAIDSTYFLGAIRAAAERWNTTFIPFGPILGSLTAAEVLEWTQAGRLPAWCEIATGSAVGLLAPDTYNGGFETAGGGGADVFANWSENANYTTTRAADPRPGSSGSYSCRLQYTFASGGVAPGGTMANALAANLKAGYKYQIDLWYKDASSTRRAWLVIRAGNSSDATAIPAPADANWNRVTMVSTCTADGTLAILRDGGVSFNNGDTIDVYLDDITVRVLGPIFKPVIQPIAVLADTGTNKIAGILTSGVTPITEKRDWVIQASTNTNGNQQLHGASTFFDATRHVIDDWCMNTAGTPTVTAGSASAGTQYKASGALAATRNLITLVTRVLASANLWCGSNDTSTIQHTVRGHMVD